MWASADGHISQLEIFPILLDKETQPMPQVPGSQAGGVPHAQQEPLSTLLGMEPRMERGKEACSPSS